MNVTTASSVLGLPSGRVDRDAVVGAWRRYAREHHPDRCPGDAGAASRFTAGREAFEALIRGVVAPPAPGAVQYGRTGVVRAHDAGHATPYEMRPLAVHEWRA